MSFIISTSTCFCSLAPLNSLVRVQLNSTSSSSYYVIAIGVYDRTIGPSLQSESESRVEAGGR